MRKFIDWFRAWRGVRRVSTQLSALDRRVTTLTKARKVSDRALEKHSERFEKLRDSMDKQLRVVQNELLAARGLNKQLEGALEASRQEVETLRDITVVGVVASSQVLINRFDALSAVEARNAVSAKIRQSEEL